VDTQGGDEDGFVSFDASGAQRGPLADPINWTWLLNPSLPSPIKSQDRSCQFSFSFSAVHLRSLFVAYAVTKFKLCQRKTRRAFLSDWLRCFLEFLGLVHGAPMQSSKLSIRPPPSRSESAASIWTPPLVGMLAGTLFQDPALPSRLSPGGVASSASMGVEALRACAVQSPEARKWLGQQGLGVLRRLAADERLGGAVQGPLSRLVELLAKGGEIEKEELKLWTPVSDLVLGIRNAFVLDLWGEIQVHGVPGLGAGTECASSKSL
jgi:hypothetical protein